jgi:hypothetical protein
MFFEEKFHVSLTNLLSRIPSQYAALPSPETHQAKSHIVTNLLNLPN